MLVGLHFGLKYRLINAQRAIGPGVKVVENVVPAFGFVFRRNQAHGTHGAGKFIQHLLRPALFHRQRQGEDFAQGFHRKGFFHVAGLVNFAFDRGERNGEIIRAIARQSRDIVGDFTIVVALIFLMRLLDNAGVVRLALRLRGGAKQ